MNPELPRHISQYQKPSSTEPSQYLTPDFCVHTYQTFNTTHQWNITNTRNCPLESPPSKLSMDITSIALHTMAKFILWFKRAYMVTDQAHILPRGHPAGLDHLVAQVALLLGETLLWAKIGNNVLHCYF